MATAVKESKVFKMTSRTAALAVLVALSGCGGGDGADAEPVDDNPLLRPSLLEEEAPPTFQAEFETSKGTFVVEVTREWAPLGADRFYTLVKNGYYDGVRFFRVIDGFIAQFGIHGDPLINAQWRASRLQDDPVIESNARGTLTFATAGPDSRTTQLFINFRDNANLDADGFSPFGRIIEGMEVAEQLYSGYGEGPPRGSGPYQAQIHAEGNEYLEEDFPDLDYVIEARIRSEGG